MNSQNIFAVFGIIVGIIIMIQGASNFKVLSPKNDKMFKRASKKALRVYYGIFGVLFIVFGVWTLFINL
jgi:uncharacterized membrane protein YidH (DUF202 family)